MPARLHAPLNDAKTSDGQGLQWCNDAGMMIVVPVADRAFKHPGRDWPKVSSPIVVMEGKVECDMQQGRAAKRQQPRSFEQGACCNDGAPDENRIVDGENRLPCRGEVITAKDGAGRSPIYKDAPPGQQIE